MSGRREKERIYCLLNMYIYQLTRINRFILYRYNVQVMCICYAPFARLTWPLLGLLIVFGRLLHDHHTLKHGGDLEILLVGEFGSLHSAEQDG